MIYCLDVVYRLLLGCLYVVSMLFMIYTTFVCWLYVAYMMHICCLYVVHMLFSYCLHMVYTLFIYIYIHVYMYSSMICYRYAKDCVVSLFSNMLLICCKLIYFYMSLCVFICLVCFVFYVQRPSVRWKRSFRQRRRWSWGSRAPRRGLKFGKLHFSRVKPQHTTT